MKLIRGKKTRRRKFHERQARKKMSVVLVEPHFGARVKEAHAVGLITLAQTKELLTSYQIALRNFSEFGARIQMPLVFPESSNE